MSSNKFPLSWHDECLTNHRRTIADQQARLQRELESLIRSEKEVEFYAKQIDEARNRGLTEFDRDRLLKPRSAKVA